MFDWRDSKLNLTLVLLVTILILILALTLKSSRKYDFANKVCVITGGSSGLGKSIASQLLKKGSSVYIIARNKKQLDEVVDSLQSDKIFPGQTIEAISADVTDYKTIENAIKQIESKHKNIDALFSCAGSSKPGFFVNQDVEDFQSGMNLNYFGTLNSVKAVVESMIRSNNKNGRIVMISSTLGLMGMIGYTQYSPTKFALRGLAECLRQELIPYGIKTSIYFVSTIKSPGYEKENQTKPTITKMIEDGDPSDPSPEARAKTLLKGVENDQFFIASDMITDIFRVLGSGISPWNNYYDPLFNILGQIIIPFWRKYSDYLVEREHYKNK